MTDAAEGAREADVAFYQPWIGALLAARPGTSTGGAETHVLLLARALARRGHRVCLVSWPVDGLPDAVDGVCVAAIPRLRRLFPVTRLLRIGWVLRALGRLDAPVIVQKNAEFDTGLVGLFARARGRRFVWAASNVSDFDYGRVERSRTNRAMFRLGVRLAHGRVVQTEEQRRLCQERFGASATVIRNPCEPALGRRENPEAFLWAGRLVSYKRPEALVELARRLPEARFRLVAIVNRDDERARLAELEAEARELPNLELLGPRPREELLGLIRRSVAVVNTSDFEGMSNVVLEGWSLGVPALALSHDPDGVIARERLGGFADGSPERLAGLARELWESRTRDDELAERCRSYVAREHAPDRIAASWERALGLRERA